MGRQATPAKRRQPSLAEYYRRHRQAFELALELGITPKEAEAELQRREAAERDREATARLEAKRNAHLPKPDIEDWSTPWMMRE